jgi:hypothetical protein
LEAKEKHAGRGFWTNTRVFGQRVESVVVGKLVKMV